MDEPLPVYSRNPCVARCVVWRLWPRASGGHLVNLSRLWASGGHLVDLSRLWNSTLPNRWALGLGFGGYGWGFRVVIWLICSLWHIWSFLQNRSEATQKVPRLPTLDLTVNLFFILVIVKDRLTYLWGSWLLHNDFKNTLWEIRSFTTPTSAPAGTTLDLTRINCKKQWLQCTTSQVALIHFWRQFPPKSAKLTSAIVPRQLQGSKRAQTALWVQVSVSEWDVDFPAAALTF